MTTERVAESGASFRPDAIRLEAPNLDQYHIERELGRGGEAVVYLARDHRHDRVVALKVLRAELSATLHAERFLREIATLSSLAHPNILPLLDSGRSGTTLYYTTPFIEGETLRQLLERERQLSIAEAIRIVVEVADALDHAHRHGVIHRDIKPENILLADGRPLLADFGIARALGQSRLTDSGLAVGSPRYMSPEQLGAEPNADARADVYSLGCVLYELLAGLPPFSGASLDQLCAQHFGAPVPSIRILRPTVDRGLERVVCKALAKIPADRFRSAGEFANHLRLAGEAKLGVSLLGDALVAPFRTQPLVWALAAVVLFGATVWVARQEFGGATATMPRRVAVMPFENRTGSEALDPIGMMLADWTTTGLQRVRTLEVVPTPIATQAYRYVISKSKDDGPGHDPIRGVATETGAQIVITGAYYRKGNGLVYRVEVTDAPLGRLLVTLEDIETPIDDPVPGIEEVRTRIMGWFAGSFDERISSEMSEGARPPVYQAYVAFSEGLDQYVSADFVTALPNFVRAYAIDTTFVAPLLYASLCASNLGQFARSDSLLSVVARHRTELTEYQRSWLAYRLAFLAGDHTRALVAIRSAANLAPDSKASYNHAVTAFQAGRAAEALAVLTAIAPERGPMRGFLPYWDVLAAVHHAMGRYDLERTVGERERRLYPQRMFAFLPSLRALAVDGRLAEIDEVLGALESLPADPIGVQFGDVLREVAEELRAHGHNEEAHRMFMRAYDWYRMAEVAARPGTRVMDVRTDRAWSESVRYPLARIAYAMGRYDEVDSLISLLRQDTPNDPEVLGLRGVAEARRGRRQAGLAIADSLQMLRSKYQFGAVTLHRARIAAVLGDHSQAMARLRESFTEGASHDLWLHRDIDLAGLRLDPQFASLVAPSNQ